MSLPILTPTSQMSKVILPVTGNINNVTTSSLPFGIYVDPIYWNNNQINAFKQGAAEQVAYVFKKLGGDVLDVEITENQVYSAYEEACLEYSYIVNTHQSKNVLPFVLGQSTGTFDSNGQLTGSDIPNTTHLSLKFPKMNFTYLSNLSDAVATDANVGGNQPIYSASFDVVADQQDYDLQDIVNKSSLTSSYDYYNKVNNRRIFIKKVYYKTPGASWNFYGYFGGLNVVGNLSTYGQYADDSTFEIIPAWHNKLQAMAYEDALKTRISDWSYIIKNNKLRLFPNPSTSSPEKFYFEFVVSSDAWENDNTGVRSTVDGINNMNSIPFQNIPYDKINSIGKQWIRRFALALAKEMLGLVRSKFGNIPIPGDSVQLNGSDLISSGQTEQKDLREELKTTLADMAYSKIGEETAKMLEDGTKSQSFIPSLIFVG
jgi:hypothetical protein